MKRHIEVLEDGITNSSGVLLASGTVKFFIGGTTTLKTVFKDFDLTIPHPNPLTLDAAGRVTAYHDGRTKLVISDSAGAIVRTVDNVGTEDTDVSAAAAAIVAGDGLIRVPGTDQLDVNDDNSTLTIISNILKVKNSGITPTQLATDSVETAKIKALNVTRAKMVLVGEQISSSSGNYAVTASEADVTNLSVSITTTGRPVRVFMVPDGTTSEAFFSTPANVNTTIIRLFRDAGEICRWGHVGSATDAITDHYHHEFLDVVVAGTYTYKITAERSGGGGNIAFYKLVAYEL